MNQAHLFGKHNSLSLLIFSRFYFKLHDSKEIDDSMMRISAKKKRIKVEINHPVNGKKELLIGPLHSKIEKNRITVNRKG